MSPTFDLLTRMAGAALAGGIVGFEREVRGHPAGLRTHALVAMGAALFGIGGTLGWGVPGANIDPTRVAAQVVTGIGFIGAGAILRDGQGVRGLTTAATIWISGALGLGFATGDYPLAWGALLIVLLILVAFRMLKGPASRIGWTTAGLDLAYEVGHGTLGPIIAGIEQAGARIESLGIDDRSEEGLPALRRVHVVVAVRRRDPRPLEDLAAGLKALPEVRSVELTRSRE